MSWWFFVVHEFFTLGLGDGCGGYLRVCVWLFAVFPFLDFFFFFFFLPLPARVWWAGRWRGCGGGGGGGGGCGGGDEFCFALFVCSVVCVWQCYDEFFKSKRAFAVCWTMSTVLLGRAALRLWTRRSDRAWLVVVGVAGLCVALHRNRAGCCSETEFAQVDPHPVASAASLHEPGGGPARRTMRPRGRTAQGLWNPGHSFTRGNFVELYRHLNGGGGHQSGNHARDAHPKTSITSKSRTGHGTTSHTRLPTHLGGRCCRC